MWTKIGQEQPFTYEGKQVVIVYFQKGEAQRNTGFAFDTAPTVQQISDACDAVIIQWEAEDAAYEAELAAQQETQ